MADPRAVCLIPSAECLIHHDVGHWVSLFEDRSEHAPTDVVLPALTMTGAAYKSKFADPIAVLGEDNALRHWVVDAAHNHRSGDIRTWALVDLHLAKLADNMTALRNQFDQKIEDSCCIVNPQVQSMLRTIFGEVRRLGVDGVALDITNIFPDAADSWYTPGSTTAPVPLQNTCFCKHCRKELGHNGWAHGAEGFAIDGNISRFVLQPTRMPLRDTADTVADRWLDTIDAAKLVEYGRFRGLVEVDSDEERQKANDDAREFIRYMNARSKVTAQAIKALQAAAIQGGLSVAVILRSALYDQPQGVNLTTLLKNRCADEYWAESFEEEHLNVGIGESDAAVPVLLRLMAARGTYHVNAVFGYLDMIAKIGMFDADEHVDRRFLASVTALGRRDQLNPGQCARVSLYTGMKGFVGMPFKSSDLHDLVKKMAEDGRFPERVEKELLARLGISKDATEDGSLWGLCMTLPVVPSMRPTTAGWESSTEKSQEMRRAV